MTDTEVIGVLRVHLEEIHNALHYNRGYLQALDAADWARTGKRHTSMSTRLTEKAYDHVEGYLSVPEGDDDE